MHLNSWAQVKNDPNCGMMARLHCFHSATILTIPSQLLLLGPQIPRALRMSTWALPLWYCKCSCFAKQGCDSLLV